jgi:predicted PurR-regulated permease PerM
VHRPELSLQRLLQPDALSYILILVGVGLLIYAHLIPAFLMGLLIYLAIQSLQCWLQVWLQPKSAHLSSLTLVSTIVIVVMGVMFLGLMGIWHQGWDALAALLKRLMQIIEDLRLLLPVSLQEALPDTVIELQAMLLEVLREHVQDITILGKEGGRLILHLLIGIVLGALVAYHVATQSILTHQAADTKPVQSMSLAEAYIAWFQYRLVRFALAFRKIVFAQLKISLINTTFTAIYLLIILPLMDIHIPYREVLVLVTFVAGILPVVGNILSNTAITLISFSVSLQTAFFSLLFLVVLHKFEYVINARIVGGQIQAKIWELLIAMFLMESLFGLVGLLLAPILYGYVKLELQTALQQPESHTVHTAHAA